MQPPLPPLPVQAQPKNNGQALTAGWLGIFSVVMYLIGLVITLTSPGYSKFFPTVAALAALAGFILGVIGLVQINRNPGQKGKGWAITGIVIGAILLCIAPVISILTLTLIH